MKRDGVGWESLKSVRLGEMWRGMGSMLISDSEGAGRANPLVSNF